MSATSHMRSDGSRSLQTAAIHSLHRHRARLRTVIVPCTGTTLQPDASRTGTAIDVHAQATAKSHCFRDSVHMVDCLGEWLIPKPW
uniref:Uncharacterized protein n=1 Tax=Cucumis melo TaxID=3656 RepID=A0A9I9EKK1_CUCME